MKSKSVISAVFFILFSGGASAYQTGEFFVRFGAAHVAPDDSSNGIAIPALSVLSISGTEAQVASDTQLGLTFNYMFSNRLGIEVLASTPFSHTITADLAAAGISGLGDVVAGEAKHLPPTLSVIFYPLATNDSSIQPYLGLGINFTVFLQERVDQSLEDGIPVIASALGTDLGVSTLPMKLDLDDSWGLAAQIGIDVALNQKWHLNTSIRWIDIDTEATFSSAGTDIISVDDVAIDPYVYQINLGYKF
jgi:outer membrane protein